MKILITYASAGAGHFKAAEATYKYFKEADHKLDIKLLDILETCNPFFRFVYVKGYTFIINYLPWIWSFLFYLTSFKPLRPFTERAHFFLNRINTSKFCDILIAESPDYIISTHFLTSELASSLKAKGKIKSRLITVVTDFGVHPLWIAPCTDMYITALGFTTQALISEGIDREKIREFGIPVDMKFLKDSDRHVLAQKLSVSPDKFTVLIVTGSFGIGPIEDIVRQLCNDVQLLVVCARNESLMKRLLKKEYPNTRVFGFVNNIEELMSVSDIMITKPGGLSISELLAKSLAPVFISAIPGQEETNVLVLGNYGVGITAKDTHALKQAVLDYKNNADKLQQARNSIDKISKPFAVKELYNAVCKDSGRAAG